jgi:hypothetical protein
VSIFSSGKKYRVKLLGRSGVVYKANGKTLLINSEMIMGNDADMVIYVNSMSAWQSPHQSEKISTEELQEIINNIENELKHIKIIWQYS